MFRRFMIVCWVLFAIASSIGAIGWAIYTYHYGEYRAIVIRETGLSDDAVYDDIWQAKSNLEKKADLIGRKIAALNELSRRLDDRMRAKETLPEGAILDPPSVPTSWTAAEIQDKLKLANTDMARIDGLLAEIKSHQSTLNRGVTFGTIAALVAFVLLLWNIIWHTGHWIWMGRFRDE